MRFMQASHLVLQLVHWGAVLSGRLLPRQVGMALWQSRQAAVHLANAAGLPGALFHCSHKLPPYLKQYDGLPMWQL